MSLFTNEKCKKFTSSCLNRELKSHQMNCVQDRLLKMSNSRFEKSLRKEGKAQRFLHEGLKREHTAIITRTPSVSDWMKQNQRHLDAWKERERQAVERRYKYNIRQYKVPSVKPLDDSTLQMSLGGTVPIGKVVDQEERGTNGYHSQSRPTTSSSAVRRAQSLIDRPKTSCSRRRATLAEARLCRDPRRHSTAGTRIRDFSSSDEEDVF